jgi:ABC-type multidrug transport system ATPase subunit
MLTIEDLTKQYKAGKPVFSGFSRTFSPGRGVGIVGPNGSGKTTFLRILSVNSFPTSGRVLFDGKNIHDDPASYLEHVGLVHDDESLPQHITAVELLEWILRNRKRWNSGAEQKIDELFDRLALEERREPIGTYSTGMKKKTQIAAALILQPRILIMDEPLRGLDKETRVVVSDLLMQAKRSDTLILMSSHSLREDEELFDEMIEFPL